MFDLRLDEIPLPASKNDREKLISWLIDTLCLHRRRGENAADDGTYSPIHRILSEHLFEDPSRGYETRELAENLGVTPAAIHHHLTLNYNEIGTLGCLLRGSAARSKDS